MDPIVRKLRKHLGSKVLAEHGRQFGFNLQCCGKSMNVNKQAKEGDSPGGLDSYMHFRTILNCFSTYITEKGLQACLLKQLSLG